MKSTAGSLAVLFFLAVFGCSDPDRPHAGGAARDSSGVRIIDLAGISDTARIVSSTGTIAGLDDLPLGAVRDVELLSETSLVIADGFANSILMVDPVAGVSKWVGRKGEGPGEFLGILFIQPDDQGGFWAFDPVQVRLTAFDAAGDLTTQRDDLPHFASTENPSTLFPIGVLRGRLAAMVMPATREIDEEGRAWGRVAVVREADGGGYEELLTFRLTRCRQEEERRCAVDAGHRSGMALVGPNSLFVLPADKPEGHSVSWDGVLEAVVRFGEPSLAFTANSFVDRSDRIWLQLNDRGWLLARPGPGSVSFVDLPEDSRPLGASGNRVALVRTNDLGVVTIEVATLSLR